MAERRQRRSRPTVEQVRAFVELVDTGSFERAADTLGFTSDQPVVRLMRRYAAAVGRGPLVVRGRGGGASVTPAGRETIAAARRFLEAVQAMSEDGGAVRLTGYPTIVERIIEGVPDLVEGPPGLILDHVDETTRHDHGRELVERVKDQTVDIAVAPAGLGDADLLETILYSWQLRVVLPTEAYESVRGCKTLRPADLHRWQIVAAPRRHRSRELLEQAFADEGLELRIRVESANQRLLRAIANKSRQLAAVIPDDAFGRPDARLGPILAAGRRPLGGSYAIYTRRTEVSQDISAVCQAIYRALAEA